MEFLWCQGLTEVVSSLSCRIADNRPEFVSENTSYETLLMRLVSFLELDRPYLAAWTCPLNPYPITECIS
jgi:hypothetical protein